jgi:hypothetical protein
MRESTALASEPLSRAKVVSELILWAKTGDLRGATDRQMYFIRRHLGYCKRKGGLSNKQMKHIKETRRRIEEHQEEVIKKEGSLEAVYGCYCDK